MRRNAGFSLIELLLAMTLLSMLLVMLFGTFHLISRGWASVRQTSDLNYTLSAAQHFSSRLLQASQVNLDSTSRTPYVMFSGTRTAVDFVTTAPTQFDVPGLYRVRFFLHPNSLDSTLMVQYQLARDGSWSSTSTSRRLVDGVTAFEIRYFGQQQQRSVRHWHSDWSSALSLPEAVRISFTRHHVNVNWTIPIRARGAELIPG